MVSYREMNNEYLAKVTYLSQEDDNECLGVHHGCTLGYGDIDVSSIERAKKLNNIVTSSVHELYSSTVRPANEFLKNPSYVTVSHGNSDEEGLGADSQHKIELAHITSSIAADVSSLPLPYDIIFDEKSADESSEKHSSDGAIEHTTQYDGSYITPYLPTTTANYNPDSQTSRARGLYRQFGKDSGLYGVNDKVFINYNYGSGIPRYRYGSAPDGEVIDFSNEKQTVTKEIKLKNKTKPYFDPILPPSPKRPISSTVPVQGHPEFFIPSNTLAMQYAPAFSLNDHIATISPTPNNGKNVNDYKLDTHYEDDYYSLIDDYDDSSIVNRQHPNIDTGISATTYKPPYIPIFIKRPTQPIDSIYLHLPPLRKPAIKSESALISVDDFKVDDNQKNLFYGDVTFPTRASKVKDKTRLAFKQETYDNRMKASKFNINSKGSNSEQTLIQPFSIEFEILQSITEKPSVSPTFDNSLNIDSYFNNNEAISTTTFKPPHFVTDPNLFIPQTKTTHSPLIFVTPAARSSIQHVTPVKSLINFDTTPKNFLEQSNIATSFHPISAANSVSTVSVPKTSIARIPHLKISSSERENKLDFLPSTPDIKFELNDSRFIPSSFPFVTSKIVPTGSPVPKAELSISESTLEETHQFKPLSTNREEVSILQIDKSDIDKEVSESITQIPPYNPHFSRPPPQYPPLGNPNHRTSFIRFPDTKVPAIVPASKGNSGHISIIQPALQELASTTTLAPVISVIDDFQKPLSSSIISLPTEAFAAPRESFVRTREVSEDDFILTTSRSLKPPSFRPPVPEPIKRSTYHLYHPPIAGAVTPKRYSPHNTYPYPPYKIPRFIPLFHPFYGQVMLPHHPLYRTIASTRYKARSPNLLTKSSRY